MSAPPPELLAARKVAWENWERAKVAFDFAGPLLKYEDWYPLKEAQDRAWDVLEAVEAEIRACKRRR